MSHISLFKIILFLINILEINMEKSSILLLILYLLKMLDLFSRKLWDWLIKLVFILKFIIEHCFLIFSINLLLSGWEYFLIFLRKNGILLLKEKINKDNLLIKEESILIETLVIRNKHHFLFLWSPKRT